MLRKYSDSKRLIFPGTVFILAVVAIIVLQNGRATAKSAHNLYLTVDCEAAMPLYDKVARYPAVLGRFVSTAAQEQIECRAFLAAQQMESQGPQAGITAYETFISDFEGSLLTTPALAAIYRIYLGWAETEKERGNFREAVSILETATADYPPLEAETEERLLQTYLAWGDTLQLAGQKDDAVSVFIELQSRYPQFSAEAQAAIRQIEDNGPD